MRGRERTGWWALVGLAAGVACSGPGASPGPGRGPAGVKSSAEVAGIDVVSFQIRPESPPVEQYGATVLHRPNAVERQILKRMGGLPTNHHPALSRMTRTLARAAPDRFNIPPALVDRLMAWNGLPHPPPHLTVVELSEEGDECATRLTPRCAGAMESLLEQVRATLPDHGEVRHGVGVAPGPGGRVRFIVAVLEPGVTLSPVPVSAALGKRVKVKGTLLGDRTSPSVELVDPAGHWRTLPTVVGDRGSFQARFTCSSRGPHQVEVLAEGQHGPEVTANFPVYCGGKPPRVLQVELEQVGADVTEEDIARKNLEYLNAERATRGLQPLQWDRRAAKIARAHSQDMVGAGFVGHRSPTTGDVSDRFARAGLRGAIIRENVARGYGPKQIHDSLMSSPGHRVNLLADDITHVGIGVVVGPPETDAPDAPRPIYVTQNFFRDPDHGVQDANPEKSLRDQVAKLRKERGLPPVEYDPGLDKLAARHARAIARGRKPPLDRTVDDALASRGFDTLERLHVETNDFASLGQLEVWDKKQLVLGLGVTARKDEAGARTYVVVLLVAARGG